MVLSLWQTSRACADEPPRGERRSSQKFDRTVGLLARRVVVVKTYEVRATREGKYWLLEIDGIGTTQARTLREAEDMATDLICIMTKKSAERFTVSVRPFLPQRLDDEVRSARGAIERLAQQQLDTARQSRDVARLLMNDFGMNGRDAATVLGVSPQRVSQLIAD